MPRSNTESLNFGLSAIKILRNNLVVGQSEITGSVTAEVNPNVVTTVGGASSYTLAARVGRTEGAGTINLNERPKWIDGDVSGGTVTDTAASASATVGTLAATNGTSLVGVSTGLTVTAPGTVDQYYDFEFEATATAEVTIRYAGSAGEQLVTTVAISDTATEIENTGVSVAGPSAPNFTVGDRAEVTVAPPHGGVSSISVPQFRTGRDYELRCYSAKGGAQDSIEVLTFPKIFIVGANLARTDVEMPAVEIPFNILAPDGGGDVYTRDLYAPTS